MPGPQPPDPEHVARVWELFQEHRSLREIAEMMRLPAPKGRGIIISHETVRQWLKRAHEAEAYLLPVEQDGLSLPALRARYMAFLDRLITDGIDRYRLAGNYEQVAPVVLRAGVEQARMLGLYAPARVALEGHVSAPAPDSHTAAIVAEMERVHRRVDADEKSLLTGEET